MKTATSALICLLFVCTASVVFASDEVMFNYTGRVRVQGQAFSGTGQFKFAIVNNSGNFTLWSNDETSSNGGEPTGHVTATVEDGIFNIMIGDPAVGMEPINRIIFNFPNQIKLRVWFSDGTHGFQQLLPDRRLLNIELLALRSGDEDFTIYVNDATGNDEYNGLTTDTAKQTIQAAVDVLPTRLLCNVTIKIADGVYREQVNMLGIQTEHGKMLRIIGDELWTPASPGNPTVQITGSDGAGAVRDHVFLVEQCYNFQFEGLHFAESIKTVFYANSCLDFELQRCKISDGEFDGVTLMSCKTVYLRNCLATANNGSGIRSELSKVGIRESQSIGNGGQGVASIVFSVTYLYNCEISENGFSGLYVALTAHAETNGTNTFSYNGNDGIYVTNSSINLQGTGSITHNGAWGIRLDYGSLSRDHLNFTIENNTAGQTTTDHGSYFYN